RAGGPLVPLVLDERGDDRAAGETRPFELRGRLATGDQRADASRPAEHLVEGEAHEVRVPAREIEPVRRDERSGVEQYVPTRGVRALDPLEWVLDAREVRLGRVGEEVVVLAADLGEVARQGRVADAKLRRFARYVRPLCAARARELADPVDGVVIVGREQEAVARLERIRLADEAQRTGRVRCEDRDILLRRCAEE